MGSVKLSMKIVCDQCGKKLEVSSKIKTYRRSSSFVLQDVYQEYTDYGSDSTITIRKGAEFEQDDDPILLCSVECVLKHMQKKLPRLKYKSENED